MSSCNGDAQKAKEINGQVLAKWLQDHSVPYDEIIFGKPLADIYVDDKAVNVCEFNSSEIERLSGFSGSSILRIGNRVIKECENAKEQADWYNKMRSLNAPFGTPDIYGVTLNTLYMQYVDSPTLIKTGLSYEAIENIIKVIRWFEKQREGVNDPELYYEFVQSRAIQCGMKAPEEIKNLKLFKQRTLCMGDMTTTNIMQGDAGLILIDPSCKRDFGSYLLDAAKFRACLHCLDWAITGTRSYGEGFLEVYDRNFSKEELQEIVCLEETHFIRVLPFATLMKEKDAEERLRTLIKRRVWEI